MKKNKASIVAVTVVGIIILVAVIGLVFTGDFKVIIGEESLQIEAFCWKDAEINLAEIDRVEYAETPFGFSKTRDSGFGTLRLTMGDCSNSELGKFTAYIYEKCDAYIVVYYADKIMVLNRETEEETEALYKELSGKIGH